jgi:asparagine synthase (glutamine-hydrolysing)
MLRKVLVRGLTALSPSQWDRVYALMQPILPKGLQMRIPADKATKLTLILEADSVSAIYQRLVSTWPCPNEIVIGGQEKTNVIQCLENLSDLDAAEHRMMALDALNYLPDDILCKVDRAAMGVSLETRMPFLDHRVVEFAWQLPLRMKIRKGQTKWALRQILYKHVPKDLIERPKMGFGVPLDAWLRGPLRDWAGALLDESRLKREGFFHPAPICQKWAEHISGQRNWQYPLWCVLMFQSWLETRGKL